MMKTKTILFSNGFIGHYEIHKDKQFIVNLMKDFKEGKEIYWKKFKETGNKFFKQEAENMMHDLALLQDNFYDLWISINK